MELISQETIFNNRYFSTNSSIEFNSLIKFAVLNNFIEDDAARLLLDNYKNAIYDQIMSDYEFDPEDDYEVKIKDASTKYFMALNDYLVSFKTPFEALKQLIQNNPKALVYEAYKNYNYMVQRLETKIGNLKEKSELILHYNFEYGFTIDIMLKRLRMPCKSALLYPTIDGNCVKDINCLAELDKIVDKLLIEVGILNKFDKDEMAKLLGTIAVGDTYNNITATVLYNYLFNNFFKSSKSIVLSDKMRESIIGGVQNSFFDIDDALTVIENGDIKFTDNEKEYIIKNFIPIFNETIIEERDYRQFVKIK